MARFFDWLVFVFGDFITAKSADLTQEFSSGAASHKAPIARFPGDKSSPIGFGQGPMF